MKEFLIEHLPFWPSLSEWDQANLLEHTKLRSIPPNQVKNLFEQDSIGVNLIKSGRIRVFAASEEGEEINLYRLFPGDACVLNLLGPAENQKLNLSAEAEVETEIYTIPGTLYAQICARNCDVRDFDRKMRVFDSSLKHKSPQAAYSLHFFAKFSKVYVVRSCILWYNGVD